jgi:hypothetical protein
MIFQFDAVVQVDIVVPIYCSSIHTPFAVEYSKVKPTFCSVGTAALAVVEVKKCLQQEELV